MEVKCSFNSIVGGRCSFDPKDRKKSREVIPFINCNRDIAGYKSFLSLTDIESEIELILSRAAIFSDTEMTICPHHRSSLSIGWRQIDAKFHLPFQNMSQQKWQEQKGGLGKRHAI